MTDPLGPDPQSEHAANLIDMARRGQLGQSGVDLAALFAESVKRGRDAEADLEDVTREANALAATVAAIMDAMQTGGGLLNVDTLDELVDRLPHHARRRVVAYRHQTGSLRLAYGWDQYGALPKVPPVRSVLRERERTIDHQPSRIIELPPGDDADA